MSPDALRSTLAYLGVRPRRSMGQNFLRDDGLARELADFVEAQPDDTVIEVGPGTGAVTQHLAGRGKRLMLIEKDARLAAHHGEVFAGNQRVQVIAADALAIDLRPFFKFAPVKLLGNLPYSVGTAILTRWLQNPSPVSRAVFMLQKEVCERLAAEPATKAYGQLSLHVQARWNVQSLRAVPPDAFHPRPKVDSAVVALTPRERSTLPVFDELVFARLVRQGFSQRRKQLKNLLPTTPRDWQDVCAALNVPETARAEELSLAQWVDLARLFDPRPQRDDAQNLNEIFDVVDEENRVIGTAMRGDVHRQALRHRAVHVLVFNRHGELLLQKRSHLKDTFPEKWDSSCSGHLDAGEDYLSCATRELNEELGISRLADGPRRVAMLPASEDTGWEFIEIFTAQHDGPVNFPAAEIECVCPFPLAEVRAWAAARPHDFASGFLKCFSVLPDSYHTR
ncbi:MAG: 16S rRNA (adenine(1518)-N(6)/adenine(1519)-N(6))-dimethyltransferase RsmA [Verrucomicrobiales bacterium]